MSVAVGVEINRVTEPDWIARSSRAFGDPFSVVGFQIENIKGVGLTTAIALLRTEVT